MLAKRYFDLRAEALGARPFSGVVWTIATNCRTRKEKVIKEKEPKRKL